MKAIKLIMKGNAEKAFHIQNIEKPVAKENEVLIKVAASGLNFADVMARKGLYKEAPALPCVLGYDVAGTVETAGSNVTNVKHGDKAFAMTRFGGYAEYAVTPASAVALIPANIDMAEATALATQYCTAYYAAGELLNLHEGDRVLVQAGAGGVGTALLQYAAYKKCELFSTAGSDEKIAHLKKFNVHHPINYLKQDFESEIKKITSGKGVDVVFDAVGGATFKKGMRSLSAGGRMVCYGAASLTNQNLFEKIRSGLAFGLYHPAFLMMNSTSIIGINMLSIGDQHPAIIQRCLKEVVRLTDEGVFKPVASKVFPAAEIAAAHLFLESRKSMGKVVIEW